jgi:hypothetical protein
MTSLAARNLADRLDTEVAMVAKKTRRLAQIFGFCVRMELAVESSTKMVGRLDSRMALLFSSC